MAQDVFFFDHQMPEVNAKGHEVSHHNPYEVCTFFRLPGSRQI